MLAAECLPDTLQRHLSLPQSSAASRFTAVASAFFILSESGERPGLESESVPISGSLYLNLGRLLRASRNSLGPLRSLRLRRCRSSSVADGSLRRSISWPAIARDFSILSVRTPARWALGPCSVAMIDLHSSQMMSAASWLFLSFAFIASNTIGCVLLQVGHQTRGNRASRSIFQLQSSSLPRVAASHAGFFILSQSGDRPKPRHTPGIFFRQEKVRRRMWINRVGQVQHSNNCVGTKAREHFL